MNALVTGGLGFIGSHIVDELQNQNHFVRIIDSLDSETHSTQILPDHYPNKSELILGDIRNKLEIETALNEIDTVFHEVAYARGGESMLHPKKYSSNNCVGTASLFEAIVKSKSIKKVILASTSCVYGEGKYYCKKCGKCEVNERKLSDLRKKNFEQYCPSCGIKLIPLPTDENKTINPLSVYALSKQYQENLALLLGKTYGVDVTILRYFNAYGARQPLDNPHTGAIASMLARVKLNLSPVVYEDGNATRDFVDARDIARANVFIAQTKNTNQKIFNVGTGKNTSFYTMAKKLIKYSNRKLDIKIVNSARQSDIRHCFADNSKISSLGFDFKFDIDKGIKHLITWGKNRRAIDVFTENNKETKEICI